MADNTQINTNTTAGDIIRDIDKAGKKTQVVTLDLGGAGAEALTSGSIPVTQNDVTSSGTLAAAAQTVILALNGQSAASVQLSGTWVGTVTFEGSNDGTNWTNINAVAATTSQPQPNATVNGLYRLTPGGLMQIRANMTTFTSGSVTVSMRASSGTGGVFANQILPTKITDGTNTATIKPASTAAVAGDLPIVVTMHPTTAVVPVTGTFFQATQPVSLATNTPTLQAGSTTAVTQATGTNLHVVVDAAPTTAVTGTFFQATQAVSATSLPLPAGASTETTLAALNTKVTAVNTGAVTISTALPTGTNSIGSVMAMQSDIVATGSITTQNLVPAGAATAGSAVELTLSNASTLGFQVTGTYTGALSLQVTLDNANWITLGGTPILNANTGGYLATVTSALTGIFQAETTGFMRVRVTALAAVTGTASLSLRASMEAAMVALDTAIPAGTAVIGSVMGSGNFTIQGPSANVAAASGNPVQVGGVVSAGVQTLGVAGNNSRHRMTTDGHLLTKPFGLPETDWQATSSTTALATTTSTAIKAAGAAGVRNYVTGIEIYNTSATVSTLVTILDGATVLYTGYLPAITTALPLVPLREAFPTPLRGTAATAINIQLVTTGANVYWNAQGYQGN